MPDIWIRFCSIHFDHTFGCSWWNCVQHRVPCFLIWVSLNLNAFYLSLALPFRFTVLPSDIDLFTNKYYSSSDTETKYFPNDFFYTSRPFNFNHIIWHWISFGGQTWRFQPSYLNLFIYISTALTDEKIQHAVLITFCPRLL